MNDNEKPILIVKQVKQGSIKVSYMIEWLQSHWGDLSSDDKKLFIDYFIGDENAQHWVVDALSYYTHQDSFLVPLYETINSILKHRLNQSPFTGGVILFASIKDESLMNPCIPLPRVAMDAVTNVHVLSWISFPKPQESFLGYSLTLLTITIGSTKLTLKLSFSDDQENCYNLSLGGDDIQLPMKFLLSYSPQLLTVSMTSTSLTLYLNQNQLSFKSYSSFKSTDKLLVTIGAGMNGDYKEVSSMDDTPCIIIHNVSVLSGEVNKAYLSSLCILGPNAQGRESPQVAEPFRFLRTSAAGPPDDSYLLELCSVDLSGVSNDAWFCTSNLSRSLCFKTVLSQNSNFGVSSIRAKGNCLKSTPLPLINTVEMNILRDLTSCESGVIISRIIELIVSVLQLDTSFIQILMKADWIRLLESSLQHISTDTFDSRLADSLLMLWETLKAVDYTIHLDLLRMYVKYVMFNTSIFPHFGSAIAIRIHDRFVAESEGQMDYVSFDDYVFCVVSARIADKSSVEAILQKYYLNTQSSASVYRGFTLAVDMDESASLISPFIDLIAARLQNTDLSIDMLSTELKMNGITEICCHLIQTLSYQQLMKFLPFILLSLQLTLMNSSSLFDNEGSILTLLFENLCGKVNSHFSPNSEDIQSYFDILFHWMCGVSVRNRLPYEISVVHESVIPLLCWCVQLEKNVEMGKMLVHKLASVVQTFAKRSELCHKMCETQCILKELLFLRKVVNTDSLLMSIFLNDFAYESFALNVPYIITLMMKYFKDDSLSFIGSFCSMLLFSLLNKQTPWTSWEMSNLVVVLSVVEEMGIASRQQIDLYFTLMETFSEQREPDAICSIFDYSDSPGLKNSDVIYEKHKSEVFSKDLVINISAGDVIMPFVGWIIGQQIDYTHYVIFDHVLIILFRILYHCVASSEIPHCPVSAVIQRIRSTLEILSSDISRYCYLFFSYVLALNECYTANPDSSKIKDEMMDILNSYVHNNSLPKIFNLPTNRIATASADSVLPNISSELSNSVMLQFIQFIYDIVQNRAIGLFICKNTDKCYQQSQLAPNHIKVGSFKQYLSQCESYLQNKKEDCNAEIEVNLQQEVDMIKQLYLGWNYLHSRILDILQSSSLIYLEKCSYYVMDPHIGKDGVRHKMMKMLPPFSPYITAEDSHCKVEVENDLRASSHLVSLLMSQRKPSSPVVIEEQTKNSSVLHVQSLRISAYDSKWGSLTIDDDSLLFQVSSEQHVEGFSIITSENPLVPFPQLFSLSFSQCYAMYKRIYCCQQSALELFFNKGAYSDSLYLFFTERKIRDSVYRKIASRLPKTAFIQKLGESSADLMKRLKLDLQWQRGEISNFEYLIRLNRVAGRSIQDITQYPIFPWVLKSYGSAVDVKDKWNYRDLTLPMGAQTSTRLQRYIEQYEIMLESSPESFNRKRSVTLDGMDDQIPPYYYGSHYSTPLGCVLYYLIRKEPFTEHNVLLQDGHFDVSDRLFYSIPVTTSACWENAPDVKELIPEWYYDTAFLCNDNHHTFGKTQDATVVDNVLMSESASSFVSSNLQALESSISSSMLNEWIDLIFGWKQQGKEAASSYNVFFYLTYPGNCDVSNIQESATRTAIQTQATHFGQCPQLLFLSTHLKKRPSLQVSRPLRNVLLETPTDSIYTEIPRKWMGSQCFIVSISGWNPSALQSCVTNAQNILGEPYSDPNRKITSITWPTESVYPWTITIDNTDYIEMTMIRVVLDKEDSLTYNIKNHCYDIEILGEDSRWTMIKNISERSIRYDNHIVSIITIPAIVTRFWKIKILDIPFSHVFVSQFVKTHPVYTSSDRSSESDTIMSNTFVTCEGPSICHLDVMGRPLFPHVPSKPTILTTLSDFDPGLTALWDDSIATINSNQATIQSIAKQGDCRTIALPYRHQIQVRMLHPSKPLFFVDCGIEGCVDCVHQDGSVRSLILSDSPIHLIAADDTLLVSLSENNTLSSFEVDFNPLPSRMELISSVLIPADVSVNQIRVSKEVDCVVLFGTSELDNRATVLIYTSSLALRGVIHCFPIEDCFITRYAILLVAQNCVYKVDFVGRVESELQLKAKTVCGDVRDSILALVDENKTILLIDAVLNKILTRIPTGNIVNRVFFSLDMTFIIGVTKNGEVLFCPLNNTLNPTLPQISSSSTLQNVKSKFLSMFS